MTTLPAERDLPSAARDEARARVVTAVRGRPAPTRRWAPLVAAAGIVAVIGTAAAAVSLRAGPAQVPPASGPAGRTATTAPGPSPDSLLAACTRTYRPDLASRSDPTPFRVRVVLRDRYGYELLGGNRTLAFRCSFDADGRLFRGMNGWPSPDRHLDASGPAVKEEIHGTVQASATNFALDTSGRVRRGVSRVVVTWPGRPPVQATLVGAHYLARVVVPGLTPENWPDSPIEVVAYDSAGNVMR